MRWVERILIALISFGVGFVVGWHPTFASVQKFIIGGVSFAVVVQICGFLRESWKERKIKQDKNRMMHHKDLIDTVIKPWYDHSNNSTMYLRNKPFAVKHLQKGYPEIYDIWFKECAELKIQISEDTKKIRAYVKNKSIDGDPLYSKLDDIFDNKQVIKNALGEISHVELEEIYKLIDDFTINGEFKNAGHYNEYVDIILKDIYIYEMFKTVINNNKLLNTKIYEFERCLENIVRDFDIRGRKLKGTCADC